MSHPNFRQQTQKVSFLEDCNFSAMLYPGRKAVIFHLRKAKVFKIFENGFNIEHVFLKLDFDLTHLILRTCEKAYGFRAFKKFIIGGFFL